MRSKFSIYGHPFHPLMVALPIGLFVWTFAADIVYLATGKDKVWYDISYWTGLAAFVTALAASLSGFGDYFTLAVKTRAAVIGAAHMVLNLALVALYIAAFALMIDDNAVSGTNLAVVVALHGIGNALLVASGILGGEMVYRHHLAVIPEDESVAAEEARRHIERAGVR